MRRYVLNSAVITSPGVYYYKLVTPEEAKRWLGEGPFLSTIGYEETVRAFKKVFGMDLPVNRKQVRMAPGDEALVFRLKRRLENRNDKGNLGVEKVLELLEIGILRRWR